MSTKPTVAVLGMGIMGAAMARQLLAANLPTLVYNRTEARTRPLVDAGARAARTPREAAEQADLLVTILSDGPAVQAVASGEQGLLEGARPELLWLQMSTVGISHCERLSQLAEQAGIGFVDAPVLGTKEPAEKGQLTVLAAAAEQHRARCAPVFDAVGKRTLWVGEVGTASRLKLVINDWLIGLVGALAEAIALAQRLEVDPARFLEAIEGGPIGPAYAQIKGKAMIEGSFPPSFPLRLARKDAQLVLEAARGAGLEPALTEAAERRFGEAVEQGHGDEDMSAVIRAMLG